VQKSLNKCGQSQHISSGLQLQKIREEIQQTIYYILNNAINWNFNHWQLSLSLSLSLYIPGMPKKYPPKEFG